MSCYNRCLPLYNSNLYILRIHILSDQKQTDKKATISINMECVIYIRLLSDFLTRQTFVFGKTVTVVRCSRATFQKI